MSKAALTHMLEDFENTARDVITSRGARVVKTIGDAVMYISDDLLIAADVVTALVEELQKGPDAIRVRDGSSPAPGTSSVPPSTWPPGSWTRPSPAASAWTSPPPWPSSARPKQDGTGWGSATRSWPRGWGRSCPGPWRGRPRPGPEPGSHDPRRPLSSRYSLVVRSLGRHGRVAVSCRIS